MNHCPNCDRPSLMPASYGHRCEDCGYRAATQRTIEGTEEILTLRGELIRNEALAAPAVADRNQMEMF